MPLHLLFYCCFLLVLDTQACAVFRAPLTVNDMDWKIRSVWTVCRSYIFLCKETSEQLCDIDHTLEGWFKFMLLDLDFMIYVLCSVDQH